MRYYKWKLPDSPPTHHQLFRQVKWEREPETLTVGKLREAIDNIFPEHGDKERLCVSIEASLIYHCLVNDDNARLTLLLGKSMTAGLPAMYWEQSSNPSKRDAAIQYLIDNGVDGRHEEKALYRAIMQNNKARIIQLREGGMLWNDVRHLSNTTILGACIKSDNMSLLKWFIEGENIAVGFDDVLIAIAEGHEEAFRYLKQLKANFMLTSFVDAKMLSDITPPKMIPLLTERYDTPLGIFSENKIRKTYGTPKQAYDALHENMSPVYIQFMITRYLKTRKASPSTLLLKAPAWQHLYYLRSLVKKTTN